MVKRILAMALAAVLTVTGIDAEDFASQAKQENAIEQIMEQQKEKCGLQPMTEMQMPEGGASQRKYFSIGDLQQEELEDASKWEQYGSKFVYNQLEEEEKIFWDTLDALGGSYLASMKNANYYGSWYGTEFVSYEGFDSGRAADLAFLFLCSNPQYYFFMPGYSISKKSDTEGTIALRFDDRVVSGSGRAQATKKIRQFIDQSVEQINKEETELGKEKAAHDLICAKVVYDYDLSSENAMRNQTIYSVILTDKTVCAGYSQAMELLCNAVGIDCMAVTSENHEWNMLRIDDVWYCTDLTWNDGQNNEIYYLYFNRSQEMLKSLEGGEEGNEGENHRPQEEWEGYLPAASRDSGATHTHIGTVYTPKEQAAAPIIELDEEGTVWISHRSGGDIYYTLDGGVPSVARTKSAKYKEELEVCDGTQIKAMAAQDGCFDSEVVGVEWPAENRQAYAGQPLVFYVGMEGVEAFQVEGLEALNEGGNAAVFEEPSGKFCWTPGKGQTGKRYEVVFSGKDKKGRLLAKAVEIEVLDGAEGEFAILGEPELVLAEGYGAAGTGSYSVRGTQDMPAISLSGNTGAGKIAWNDSQHQIEVAPGLTEGLYQVVLTAFDGQGKKAELSVGIRIVGQEGENHLPVFVSPAGSVQANVGQPLVFYVRASDADLGDKVKLELIDAGGLGENVQFDPDSGKFCWTPGEDMLGQSCKVTFAASDHTKKKVRHTVEIQVRQAFCSQQYAASEDAWIDASYSGRDTVGGRSIFLRANRDALGELGEGLVSLNNGNRLILLKFDLRQLSAVETAELSLVYICRRENAKNKQNGRIRVACAEGFAWNEDTVSWKLWDAWRNSSQFTVDAAMVRESEAYELGEMNMVPDAIHSDLDFQGVQVKTDITDFVVQALQRGQEQLTLLVNTKEAGEEFFVSKEGAVGRGKFICAEETMAPSLFVVLPMMLRGPAEISLTEGYASAETDSFAVLGTEKKTEVTVSLADEKSPYADYFQWNAQTRQLQIAAGLPRGEYEVILTAQELGTAQAPGNRAVCKVLVHVTADQREELQKAYQEALQWGQGRYTSASQAKYQLLLSQVARILENPSASSEEIARTIAVLSSAKDVLETLEDAWKRLFAANTKPETEKGNYTPASWEKYQKELEKIRTLSAGFTEEEMNEKQKALAQAAEILVLAADKRQLKSLLDWTNTLVSSDYTPESYQYLATAREEALTVYGDENAAQNTVDASAERLRAAVGRLVRVKNDETGAAAPAVAKKICKNQKYTDAKSKIQYQVTNVSKRTVKVMKGTNKNATSVTIPAAISINGVKCSVTEIGANAFRGFRKLKKADVGSKVTKIGRNSFSGCKKLSSVTIGANVKIIEKQSFYQCAKLKKITIKGTKLMSVKARAFKNTGKKMRLALPKKMNARQKRAIKKKLQKAGANFK